MKLHRRTFLRAAGVSLALAAARRASPPARAGRAAAAAADGLHLHAARAAPAALLPGEGRQGLRALAVPGSPQGLPRRLHGHLRAVAPGRRPEPRLQLQLPDRRPAPGAAGRLQEHASRSTSSRPSTSAARRGSPACRCRARASACRGPAAARPCRRSPGRRACSPSCSSRAGPTRSQAQARRLRGRPEHPRRRPRPGQDAAVRGSAPATATSSTSTSPASASWSSGWPRPRRGRRSPSRRSTPSRRRTSRTRPTSSARRGCWFDLIHLALQTDSTRLVTIMLGTSGVPPIPGVTLGHHDLSHHGKDPAKLAQLKTLETEKMKTLRDFLEQAEADEGGRRHPARPDDGLLQQQPGRRQHATASRTCRCSSPAAASSTASTSPSTRRQPAAVQPVRLHAPAPGPRGGQVRQQHRHADRAGNVGVRTRNDTVGTGNLKGDPQQTALGHGVSLFLRQALMLTVLGRADETMRQRDPPRVDARGRAVAVCGHDAASHAVGG